jgi:hypothetical protein
MRQLYERSLLAVATISAASGLGHSSVGASVEAVKTPKPSCSTVTLKYEQAVIAFGDEAKLIDPEPHKNEQYYLLQPVYGGYETIQAKLGSTLNHFAIQKSGFYGL